MRAATVPDTLTVPLAGFIELGAGIDPQLTARENIFLNGTLLGYSKAFIESKFDDIVEFSELQDFLDSPVKNFSSRYEDQTCIFHSDGG